MIISSNDGRRVAIHNIIYLNPGCQTLNGLVMKLLAKTLSQFCSKSIDTEIKKLRFCPNSFIICEVLRKYQAIWVSSSSSVNLEDYKQDPHIKIV